MKRFSLLFAIVILLSSHTFLNPNGGYEPGDQARDFSLKNVDGTMVSLSDYKDAKGFIVIFTCNHCPFAKLYEERIIELNETYKPKGFPVIAINPNDPEQVPADSYENMKKRAQEKNYKFPYLFDESQEVAQDYGAEKTPHTFVLNRDGDELIVEYIGAIDDNPRHPEKVEKQYVAQAVDELLKNHEVTIKETKAIGCTVKWK